MIAKEIEVQLLGKHFNFNIPDNIKTEDFLEVVDYVESKFKKIKSETQDLDSFKLGLLVSINIAEEFFSLKKEHEKLKVVLNRIDNMLSHVDEGEQIAISFSS
jgi:cell division protein ZapA (FtsZ GTPase activity inhibitor)